MREIDAPMPWSGEAILWRLKLAGTVKRSAKRDQMVDSLPSSASCSGLRDLFAPPLNVETGDVGGMSMAAMPESTCQSGMSLLVLARPLVRQIAMALVMLSC